MFGCQLQLLSLHFFCLHCQLLIPFNQVTNRGIIRYQRFFKVLNDKIFYTMNVSCSYQSATRFASILNFSHLVIRRLIKGLKKISDFFKFNNRNAENKKALTMTNTSMWKYISSCSLIVWPYKHTYLHENCIVTAYLYPSDKIYKIVKSKSNIQNSQNSKLKAIKNYRIIKAQVKS